MAADTSKRTLLEAFEGADIAIGLKSGDKFSSNMLKAMNKNPVIFALS